jgi:hypothetical protein
VEALSTLFSPARMAFVGYIILVSHGVLGPRRWWLITLLFFVAEILHNDVLRPALKKWGDRLADWNWKKRK